MFLAINNSRIRCALQTVVVRDQLLHRTSPSISWQDKDSVTVHNMPARNGFLYQWTIKRPSPDAWERGRLVPFAVRLSISPVVRNTPRVQYRRIRASVRRGHWNWNRLFFSTEFHWRKETGTIKREISLYEKQLEYKTSRWDARKKPRMLFGPWLVSP